MATGVGWILARLDGGGAPETSNAFRKYTIATILSGENIVSNSKVVRRPHPIENFFNVLFW